MDQPDLLTHQRNVLLGLFLALAAAAWAVLDWHHADATMRMTVPVTVGPRYVCGIAMCGACTVHINGVPVRSCSLQVGDVTGEPAEYLAIA